MAAQQAMTLAKIAVKHILAGGREWALVRLADAAAPPRRALQHAPPELREAGRKNGAEETRAQTAQGTRARVFRVARSFPS